MSVNLSPAEIAELQAENLRLKAENQELKAENADIKQSILTVKGAVLKMLVEFGIFNEQLQPQKLNKFKLAKKVGGLILSAMDGENIPILQEVRETVTPLIDKYTDI